MADLLELDGLTSGHGAAVVIRELSLRLAPGERLAVLGRNGVGKTTLLDSIIGVTRHMGGRVLFGGRDITRLPPERRARAGIGWVPQERRVFPSLTVQENLTTTARPGEWDLARVYRMFPALESRRRNMGNQLSGGEQQMLAIGRALMLNPRLLLLDEPSEGLAPIIVKGLLDALARIAESGIAMIVVEQHARKILSATDRAIVLDRGRIVHRAASADLLADPDRLARYLGVAAQPALPGSRTDS